MISARASVLRWRVASKALIDYREWLKQNLPNMRQDFVLGDKAYGFFLHQVALLPYTPEQLLTMARQDFERVLAMESYEHQRDSVHRS